MSKLKLDLHPIARDGNAIEAELNRVIEQALSKRIRCVEIVPGKGSGQLKKRVLRFLERPGIKACYARVEKDSRNTGRLFVHFDHRE
jgi:DNA-nicking Smr family endonuclease